MTVKRLRFHPLARIKFPDEQKMQRFAEMISLREPTISNVIGFMDGLGLAMEITDKRIQQNAYYCGYDCDTMVNNVLVFGPDHSWECWRRVGDMSATCRANTSMSANFPDIPFFCRHPFLPI
jgi:hypothetical protein